MDNNSLIAGIFVVAGLACSTPSVCAADGTATTAAQDYLSCVGVLSRDPRYAEITAKLPLRDFNTISFSMLADDSRPTPEERKEIAAWFDGRDQCWKESEAVLQSQWPPELFQLSNEGSAGMKAIGIALYKGKLTFGEANKQIEQLGNSIKARIIPIVKQYQADAAAQKAVEAQQAAQRQEAADRRGAQQQAYADAQASQAELQRQQRAQLFLNYLRANQPPPLQLHQLPQMPQTRMTNCNTSGNTTNCISQ
jgi:hypothetical protein